MPGGLQGLRLHELGTDTKERILVVVLVDLFGWVCEQEVHRRVVLETCHVSDDSPRKKVVGEKEFLGVNERYTVVVGEERHHPVSGLKLAFKVSFAELGFVFDRWYKGHLR